MRSLGDVRTRYQGSAEADPGSTGRGRSVGRVLRLLSALAVLGVGTVTVLAGMDLLAARAALGEAADRLGEGRTLVEEAELEQAVPTLEAALEASGAALQAMSSGPVRLLSALPVVGPDLRTARGVAVATRDLSQAAVDVVGAVVDIGGIAALGPVDGVIEVTTYRSLAAPLATARDRSADVLASLTALPTDLRRPEVAQAVADLVDITTRVHASLDRAAALVDAAPGLLGADGTRRYFVAAQNPAEQRGTGGLMGAWTILEMRAGRLHIRGFSPIQDLPELAPDVVAPPHADYRARYDRWGGTGVWRSLNMTADFPTAGRALLALYEEVEGVQLDGVVAVDPVALRGLLQLTGPVDAPSVGQVGPDNVVRLLANDAFGRVPDPEQRKRLLGDVAGAALQRFLTQPTGGRGARAASVVAELVSGRHVQLYVRDEAEQAALRTAGIDAGLHDGPGDLVHVSVNNASANKVDFYVDRHVDYRVALRPDGAAEGLLQVTFDSAAPTSGLPGYVLGPAVEGLGPGDLLQFVDIVCTRRCVLGEGAGSPGFSPVSAETELGHTIGLAVGRVPAGGEEWVQGDRVVQDVWGPEGEVQRYTVTVVTQPVVRPTRTTVSVVLPAGARATAVGEGGTITDDGASFELSSRGGTRTLHVDFVLDRVS